MKKCMDKNQEPDPRLNTPAEANKEKHINFMDIEEEAGHARSREEDEEGKVRRRQWKNGLAEGEQARGEGGDAERSKDRPSGAMPMKQDDTLGIP